VDVAWRRLLEAQRRNRRNHMFVCERFVDDGTSLLQEYYAAQRGTGDEPQRGSD
jgi:hypothetical protein